MAFEKLVSFTKDVSDLDDQPAMTAAELKAQFDAAPDEVRQYLNQLIDALQSTEIGDSGAKNTGATTISGVAGNDVQTILENLKTYIDGKIGGLWTQATLLNGWANYDSIRLLQYRKIGNFGVQVLGTIKNTAGSTPTTTIFTLPSGMRPPFTIYWIADASPSTSGGPTEMSCDANGNVNVSAWRGSTADYLHVNYIIPIV